MSEKVIVRKEFISALGKFGAGTCLCAAAAGMNAALNGEPLPPRPPQTAPPPKNPEETKPGDKTVARQAKRMEFGDGWLRRFFEAVDQTLDEPSRARLMTANGKSCYGAFAGPAKQPPRPDEVERFLQWIAAQGKERGYAVEGKVISFEFVGSAETGRASPEKICLCPMAEGQLPGKISPTFCLCSVGYVKEMHERRLGRSVEVELVDSVLKGGSRCRFRMTVV
jgi:hypothetical protein